MEAVDQLSGRRDSERRAASPGGLAAQLRRRPNGLKPGSSHHSDCALESARVSGESAADLGHVLQQATSIVSQLRSVAVSGVRLLHFPDAADFAGKVEELSRTVEFLQIVAADTVERTRREAQARVETAPEGWRTGWAEPPDSQECQNAERSQSGTDPLDDGYRNAAEFLRARLRIGVGEARRRLALASVVLPQSGIAGQVVPARHEELAQAIASASVPSRSATVISLALDQVRHVADAETRRQMEQALTRTAVQSDTDFVARMARRWTEMIDQDGAKPSEEELRHRQGAFFRRPHRGLHHVEIFATTEQFETLATVMNTATNPRLLRSEDDVSTAATGTDGDGGGKSPALDQRSRAQRLLDGLVGACGVALASGELSAAGGLRPQVMVTIDYRDLLSRINARLNARLKERGSTGSTAAMDDYAAPQTAGEAAISSKRAAFPDARDLGSGSAIFTGPMTASTIRKIACDADIIPVLLGSQGRILDVGRATRVFPPHIRKAITARDQGCAFPECTMPAPWCEAHHITYWSRGGTTGTENGTLLCSHHHHLIHKEQWRVEMRSGVPWFIPPPHLDQRQVPRRNFFFAPSRS